MDIGNRRQLFVDDRFIEKSTGIELCMNTPVQHPDPVLFPDQPWEQKGIGAYNTVMREAGDRFRLWYDTILNPGLPSEGARRLCYAESKDGLHWEKPSLGLIEFRGSKDNNIVAPRLENQSTQGACVYLDERAPAEQRYKLWSKYRPNDEELKKGELQGLWAMYSIDGIHWNLYTDQPNPKDQMCDTQNMFFFDEREGLYVGYTRVRETQIVDEAAQATGKRRYRCVGRITSPDFHSWNETQIVFEADSQDLNIPVPNESAGMLPVMDYYTGCVMKYEDAEDVYLMFTSAFYHWGAKDPSEIDAEHYPGTMDAQLLVSRDGISWKRAGERKAYLRNGFDGSATSSLIYPNPWLIPVGNELWQYYSSTARRHVPSDSGTEASGLFRASIRRDGFISVDAGYQGGEFSTPALQFEGETLELNFDGSAGGWLKVEILDVEGKRIPGYTFEDADIVRGNSIHKKTAWNGCESVGKLAGRPVKLRFVLRDAKLYAMQFTG